MHSESDHKYLRDQTATWAGKEILSRQPNTVGHGQAATDPARETDLPVVAVHTPVL